MAKNKDKIEVINNYLKDEYMLIHFDARKSGVELPDHLMQNPTVTLKLSYAFQGGMEVTEERVWASLLFSGKYRDCFVPVNSIWGATSSTGANTIWPDDAPPEVMMQVIETLANKGVAEPEKIDSAVSKVPGSSDSKNRKPIIPRKGASSKPRPSHLKRIK